MNAPLPEIDGTLSIVNHPASRLAGASLLHQLVQHNSQNGQPAIEFLASDEERISISYSELHYASETLATRISALAGPHNDSGPFVVPVLVPQSPELYIALLAILKAGGAFCPMNLDLPLERTRFILENVSAKVIITTSEPASRLPPDSQAAVLIIDSDKPNESAPVAQPRQPLPTDLAYVMYTSGSTGTPKGVGVSHDAVTQSLLAHDRHIPPFSRFLQFAAPTFDVSVFEIFFPLFRGQTVVSCARAAMLNDLPGVIRRMDVDACELTPSVAGSLLRTRENAPGLRLLLTIGEMLTQPVAEEFGGGGDDEKPSMLWGMYGPTEAAIHCTLQPAFASDSTVRNIGVPLDTVSAFILGIPEEDVDAKFEFRVLPRGEVGELAVGGYQLAEGYLNRLGQTASAFVDTPYGRLYRTGDKARMLPDGTLECLGRIVDGQVKLRGQRMELGEVEHAALRTAGCHGAVAAVVDATLVLFCAIDGKEEDMAVRVMESCRRWLPGFMLPGDVVVVDRFPCLASGKVDRKRLVAEYNDRMSGTAREILPYKDEWEQRLCEISSECFGVRVDAHQDLSRAGLDSLSAIKLASMFGEAGFEVGAITVLEARTVSALHRKLRSTAGVLALEPETKPADPLELDISDVVARHPILSAHTQPIESIIPCTPLQASMLAETMAHTGAYCNWMELSVSGTHTEESVRSWFAQLAQANEVLRTGFIHHEGQFMQVIFQTFGESNIWTTNTIVRAFDMKDDQDLLRPVLIQISPSKESGETTVLLQLHHAVYDGWSLDLVLSDLARLARGEQLNHRPRFREISAYYSSTAFRIACDSAREFWAGNLLGFQPPALPIFVSETSRTPAVLSSSASLGINPQDLKSALKRIDCGPQTIFQAALAWLWSSMVGSEDVVVGSIQSGRTMPISRIEDIIGPCIAAVPLRTDLSQVRTIRDLLVSVQAGNRATLPHSILPLSEIKRAAGIRSGQSIYDVLFIYQESLHSKTQASDIVRQVAHQDYLETKFLVEVEPRERDFNCRFTHHSDVFPDNLVKIIGESIRALVFHMLDNLDSEISSIRTAFPRQLLSVYNRKPKTFTGVPDLAKAVEDTAAKFPDRDAVCFAGHMSEGSITTTTITFSELNTTADRIACHLGQQGSREGGVVAIIMEKSVRLYAGIFAILKAGCAYLPLLPSTPVARTAAILQQAQVDLCLVDTATLIKLRERLPCHFIDLQTLHLHQPTTAAPRTNPNTDPDRLAYIIYTSGSTGVPKGVCVTQRNIMSNLDALSRIYPVKQDSRLLQSCSQAFDVSVFEIFFAWTQGMCLCSGTNDTLFEDLERSIRKLSVTHLSMTPTVASLVDPAKVPRVEFLVTAGEPMTEVVARRWGDKLYQGYGPSETTNICSVKKMGGPGQVVQHLGWSFDNTSTFVLAKDGMELVPLGCLGEFCFGGDQVAQGYLGMDELTAAKFVNHPALGRIYRSGDLGRMLPDGSMVIVGRTDEQIKIRGQRVELSEITEAVRQAGNVVDCATLFLRGEETGSRDQIISYFVPEQRETAGFRVLELDDGLTDEVRTLYCALTSRLPSYMIPSAVVPISTLPTTASGKLDRSRLKQAFTSLDKDYLALVSHGAELNAEEDGEWSAVELQVAEAVSSALHVSKADIRRWAPLVTLGLDSISAIQVAKQLHAKLGKRLPISLILQNASVARLAQGLRDMDRSSQAQKLQEAGSDLLPKDLVHQVSKRLEQAGRPAVKVLPCTPLQEAMLATTSTGKGQYLNRMLFRVNGDLARLHDAWNAMCARHDILRTCFLATADARWPIVQAVLEEWQPLWYDFDASQCGIEDCISRHAGRVANAVDSMEPAVSFATITQNDRVYLSFVCHHALYDGVAVERLLQEVERHCSGLPLPPTPPYEQFLRESLNLPGSTDKFWLQHLAGYESKLITDLSSELVETLSGPLTREFDLPLSHVQGRIRELGVSLLALTQAAWAATLGCVFRTDDVCFGNVVSGRSLAVEGINELVAPCFNTIPIRMDFSRSPRHLDLMKAFQSLSTELMAYQFTPLRRIQSLFSQHGTRRLFDTLLLLQHSPRMLDQSLWTLERDDGEMDVPLVCEVIPDTRIDRVVITMHNIESQALPNGIADLILDLLSHFLRNCLRYPSAQNSLNNIPQGLSERLSHIRLPPPQPHAANPVAHNGPDSASEVWTATESSIREVVAALSPREAERIRRQTTIYQLGLDSIGAVQIASMLRKAGHQVSASDVIEHPTCESLARHIDSQTPESGIKPLYDLAKFRAQVQTQISIPDIATDFVEAIMPCTPLQCAMMAQFVRSGGRDYFNFVDFELGDDSASVARLTEAWQALCRAHPILRTAIVPVEHGDCAFAMVQFRSDMLTPALTTIPRDLAATFGLKTWQLEAARAAAEVPHRKLWAVAIVDTEKGVVMHLAMHHALYDAYSLQVLLDDLSKAAKGGELTVRVRATEEGVADIFGHVSAAAAGSAEFWAKQANRVVINSFPVMTPLRQDLRHILTEAVTSNVPSSTLEVAASESGHPLQVILQAAWTRVLSAYLGEDSVVFGIVLSGRNTEATRDAVFPCITTLPVISANHDSNRTLLTQMLRYSAELYKQQHQPLTRIQQWLGCPDSRLFDTLLVYQKLDRDGPADRPWRIVGESANVDYPVSIEVEPKPGGRLGYQATFFSDLLSREQALVLLQQFDAAVQHLALEPDGHEADLFKTRPDLFSILPPEVPAIPTTVNLLHEFVEIQALKNPDATALHFVNRFEGAAPVGDKWTYKELDDNGNRVAHMLLPHVQPGAMVAVYFEKCPEAYFSILGILKAGCAFVALDPGAPRTRNEFILHDSGASVLLLSAHSSNSPDLPTISIPVLTIDKRTLSTSPPSLPRSPQPSSSSSPPDVCYTLYTSGTTGTPKGCAITHDNAVQCMLAFQHIFRGRWHASPPNPSRWLQFASLHFDVSVLEQYFSWSVGITLVSAPRDLMLDDLAGFVARLGITHIDLTPSLARLLRPEEVPSLCEGVFITGGEALREEILEVWGATGAVYNFYGPTEATIGVTAYPRVPGNGRVSNIGRQFVNVGSYVLKPGTEQPVLRGGVGELCVSGRLVGKGYLGREELTAERFPTLKQFGERVYRTGDLVRVLHDGCFDFLGRADDQVKLRGQRLEIGEINHAIRKGVDAVRDVATLVVRNEAQQKDLLVSFVVADGQSKKRGERAGCLELVEGAEAAALCRRARDACRSKLPGYMVPTYVLQLPFIPLSANNKAEIKELRRFFASLGPDKLVALSSSADTAGRTLGLTGTRVARVIAKMQEVEMGSITPESSIFELGIDSISVLRLSRALRNEGFPQASPSLILRNPLIGDLAAALEVQTAAASAFNSVAAARQLVQACAHKHRSHVCRELGVTPDEIEYIAPCSPLQQGMISRSTADGAYFNTFRFVLAPEVSSERLRKAFERAADALPILRTRFVATADGFVQAAINGATFPWTEAPLDSESSARQAIRKTRESWIARNRGVLAQPWEAVLLHADGECILVLHIFHGLYDANSFALVMDRVAAEYLAQTGESAQSSPASTPSFLDALCHGPLHDFSSSKAFWVKHLEGATFQPVPTHRPGSSVITSRRKIPFDRLATLKTGLGATHQALVQAAFVSALVKHLSADPTIGVIVSGRSIELDGAERVVGPLFNTLPFHARMVAHDGASGTNWSALIRQCHDFNTTVLPFQHAPLRDIQKWCSGGSPLFDTLFSFQREEQPATRHEQLWTVVESEPEADYLLALEATLGSDGCLDLFLVAQRDEHGPDELSEMMGDLEEALEQMAGNPDGLVRFHGRGAADGVINGAVPNGHALNALGVNGHLSTTHTTKTPFQWTQEAVTIRNEMAALADTDPGAITETTPLFGLGLDSIDVIKLSARLKRRGIELKTGELMKAQTIAAMMQHLQAQLPTGNADTNGTASPRTREISLREYVAGLGELSEDEIVLPTTPLQESMIVEMVDSDFQLYFNHDILELAPSVDMHKLKEAWGTVIAGSPILRTRFLPVESPSIKSSYCQVIGREASVYMTEVSLDSQDELAGICDTATLRACKGGGQSNLLQLAFALINDRKFLVLSIAHALYDGWSLGLVYRDVQAAYHGLYRAQSLESYVAQLGEILFPDHRDASTFWSGFLQDATPTLFPRDEGNSSEQEVVVHRHELTSSLPPSEIASFCKAHAITLQTLAQACWAALLAAKTGSLDITFGVVLSCRDTEALDKLVFPTMNTVAVRSILHGTVASWLRYMQDNMAGGISTHQHFPLREALKLAQGTTTPSNGPLFNTLLIQQRAVEGRNHGEGDGQMWMRSVGGSSAVEYPVCVEVEMAEAGLVWRMACEGRYGSQEETKRMLQRLDQILRHLIRSPEADVLVFSGEQVSICGLSPVELRGRDKVGFATRANGSAEGDDDVWSPLEEAIRDVLAEVSGVPAATIARANNIYHLGLDSISAIKVASLLRKKGLAIGFRDMLKTASISEMAQLVCNLRPAQLAPGPAGAGGEDNSELAVPGATDLPSALHELGYGKSVVEDVFPASPMQVHMLSVWQNTQGAVFYPCFTYSLSGQIDSNAIHKAWKTLVNETPVLRTVFVSTSSRSTPILQVILRPSALAPSRLSPDSTAWDSKTSSTLSQPYNSLHAKRSSADSWTLQLKIHHALYDAVSLPATMDRFAALCRANTAQSPPGVSPAPRSNWHSTLAPRYATANVQVRKEFWTSYLAGAKPLPLLSFEPSSSDSASRISVIKPSALQGEEGISVSRLTETCRASGISFQALFFAAYAHFLAAAATPASCGSTGRPPERSVVFGIYLASRASDDTTDPGDGDGDGDRDGTSGTSVDPLLRLVPLRVQLPPPPPPPQPGSTSARLIMDVAAQVQRDIHAISDPVHVEVGLWEVKEWVGVEVDSFVNFLGTAAHEPVIQGDRQGGGGVRLELVKDEAAAENDGSGSGASADDQCGLGFEAGSEIAGNPVRDAYPDAIDVEVSVKGEDMTIGVFGSGKRLSREGADRIIDGIVEVLKRVE
ncbi:non-ribosomal peptide synthetase [Achaetomium macrosporum]|uniref:Non-ribosomal peptide synthetase n=1 Tax=Achaetomium macrosporum TaxID=79813 RepID=A0AAN7C724_9PEZI|nr:non-ribosomal peptide synthetase [Achaetomium macrosporum]